MELPLGEWLRKTAWPVYPLLAIPALLAYFAARTPLGESILGLIVISAIAAGVYWAITFFAAYDAIERADLLALVRRRPREGVA
jgi:hypothetical protein